MKRVYVNEEWCLGCHLCEYNCAFANSNEDDMILACKDKTLDANKVDICDEEVPCYIQAKYTQNMPNYFTIRDSCGLKDKPFVMCWKKAGKDGEPSPGTVAVIPIDYFYQLISKLK